MASAMFSDFQIADQIATSRGARACLLTRKASKERATLVPEQDVVDPIWIHLLR